MYPNFLSRSLSLSTPRRQRAQGASTKLDNLPPASLKSQSFGNGVASAAKSGLPYPSRHPGKNTLGSGRYKISKIVQTPKGVLTLLITSAFSSSSSEPPVLALPASAFARVSLLPALQPEPQKDAPTRRHTYKLFPSTSPPPQIISPVYGVNVLHRNIGSKDYQVVLPRLRDTQTCSSFNSTPPIDTEQNPKVAHMGGENSIDEHPLKVSDLERQRGKAKEKDKDHKKSTGNIGMKESQPNTSHKENINYAPPSRPKNIQGLKLGRCLRIKPQSLKNRAPPPVKVKPEGTDSNISGRRKKTPNNFGF
ncbi:hypothetical protein BGX38DRAFT_924697 [Terfezia claveryi]|nr:hypothetical protein BGX38DRAFT_924697 [Terfezia claveryi]